MNAFFRVPPQPEQYTVASVFGTPDRRQRARPKTETRELIPIGCRGRFDSIIVIRFSPGQAPASWGQDMGKAGAKRKAGAREPNGKLQRPTVQALNEMAGEKRLLEMKTVLNQPHRRGSDNKMAGCAIGRFCIKHRLQEAVWDACNEYFTIERKWLAAKGAPKGFEQTSGAGTGAGPSTEQMATWTKRLNEIHAALKKTYGQTVFSAVRRMVIEDMDPEVDNERPVISALGELAVVLGHLTRNPHPYVGSSPP